VDLTHLILLFSAAVIMLRAANWVGFFEATEIDRLWGDFHADRAEPKCQALGDWSNQCRQLPLILMVVDGKTDRITFATNAAKVAYDIYGKLGFEDLGFAFNWKEAIRSARGSKKETAMLELDDHVVFLLFYWESDHVLDNLIYVEVPRSEIGDLSRFRIESFMRALFPVIQNPELPQINAFGVASISVVIVRIVGLGEWSDAADAAVIDRFTKEFANQADVAAGERDFTRLFAIGGDFCFANATEGQRQVQMTFFKICIDFGRELRRIVATLRRKYGTGGGVFGSVVFYKGNKMNWKVEKARVVQPDLFGDGMAGRELVKEFGMDGIGFGTFHKERNRFANMTKVRVFEDGFGREVDIHMVI
jgi:hypothetical protein